MVTEKEALWNATINWAVRRMLYDFSEDTPDALIIEKMMADLQEQWDELKAKFHKEWGEPVEAPCGWIFYRQKSTVGGLSWFFIDLWTGKSVEDINILDPDLPVEASLRLYIESLPEPERLEAQKRMHLMPYSPERFYPPRLDFFGDEGEDSEPHEFEVEFDPAFFAKRELSVPDLILVDIIILQLTREEQQDPAVDSWLTVKLPEAIQRIWRKEEEGLVRDKYRIVIPASSVPSQRRRVSRHVEVRCQYSGISPTQEKIVQAEHLDRCTFPIHLSTPKR